VGTVVKLVKSEVKCYKKKTKKMVNGRRKTYQYNQYLVPLKRSDGLKCDKEVFIVSQEDIVDFLDEEGNFSNEIIGQAELLHHQIDAYERELADLEWKHGELSRTYKELVSKNTKINQKWRKFEDEINELRDENESISKKLDHEKNKHLNLKKKYEELKEKDRKEKDKVVEEEISKQKGDFWSVFKKKR
jgi:DNA repair exonuclease SbcCD ATPase subunit